MKILRTPDERFEKIDGYTFTPNYIDVPDGEGGQLRMHYVDEGPRDGQPVVMVHGNPTWSYMWRRLIPRLADAEETVARDRLWVIEEALAAKGAMKKEEG